MKTNLRILSCIISIIATFYSCKKDLEIPNGFEPALNVFAVLEAGKEIKISAAPVKGISDTLPYSLINPIAFLL